MRSVWSEAEAEALESPVFGSLRKRTDKKPPEFKKSGASTLFFFSAMILI